MTRIFKYRSIKKSVNLLDIEDLIEQFNSQVGKRCWTSARAVHDISIIESLIGKGIDVSTIYDGHSISFSRAIALNESRNKIIFK
ncbi:hypothetical protein SAMN04488494_0520 [Xylanibacter ruminicola]|uniref:Uncharacterized protein n=1 Tax=Xylanibacter ruminicola TaxID=839 RepID=A0A1M7CU40_XYLRU|nr:hypothetical protein [Xylanibacter ruminicola]SHL70369.1 hypothetical protein SAMN04488494_0520 [Xylanibacter ruminicola]